MTAHPLDLYATGDVTRRWCPACGTFTSWAPGPNGAARRCTGCVDVSGAETGPQVRVSRTISDRPDGQPTASQRRIAGTLGVSEQSVARDLGNPRGNAPKGAAKSTGPHESEADGSVRAPKGAPADAAPPDLPGEQVAKLGQRRTVGS